MHVTERSRVEPFGQLRLVHVVPAISEEASGPTYSVRRLCESLIAQGHALELIALDWAPLEAPPPFLRTFPLGAGPRRLGRSPSMLHWLAQRCNTNQVDVLHNHGMWQMNAVYPAWAAKRSSAKLVFSPRGAFSPWAMRHGSKLKRVFWPLLQLPALRHAQCFHATAESEYEDIRRLGFNQPVALIPNGIDLPALPTRRSGPQRTLLFLGRIHVVKGLDILLRAWRAVQGGFPNWRLMIAGDDDGYHGSSGYLDKVRAEGRRLGVERVEFTGPLYGDDKLRAYREADLYVLPSRSENFAVTVAEALSMETPSVVSKGAPWHGLSEHGAGWWVDIGVDPLIICLKDAMGRSPEELGRMGQRGRAWMQRQFSWQSVGASMSETYRWLCAKTMAVPPCVRLE